MRQKVIARLGRLDELQEGGELDRFIEPLAKFFRNQWIKEQVQEFLAKWAQDSRVQRIYSNGCGKH